MGILPCVKATSLERMREGERKEHSSSLAPKAKAQTDGKIPRNVQVAEEESLSGTRGEIPCLNFFREECTNPSCDLWHPPVCLNCKSESGCKYGDICLFRHVEADGQPSKKSKKCGTQRKVGKLGSNHTVKFSKGTWHHIKIRERKGPSRGVIQK